MTRSDARTLMAGWLDDPNQTYFTPALMNVWLNLAQRTVQLKLIQAGENYYEKPVETTLEDGQADYALPSDCVGIHRIEIVLSGTGVTEERQKLEEITNGQMDMVSIEKGIPGNYLLKKDRITLFSTPDASCDGKILRLYYAPRVEDLTGDADTLDVPEQYAEYTAALATLNGFVKDDRAPENLMLVISRNEKLLEKTASNRTIDRPRQIVETGWDD